MMRAVRRPSPRTCGPPPCADSLNGNGRRAQPLRRSGGLLMTLRLVVPFAAATAGLLLAACATGSAPSFADSGPAAAPPPAAPALPPGPVLAASGNAVLPIYDLGG